MRSPVILLVFGLFFLSSLPVFSQLSQSDEEYEKDCQDLIRKYGGFSKNSTRKSPREYLGNDKKLLDIFEKAKTFDSHYFKDDYQPSYERCKELVAQEEILANNYYYWLGKYQKTSLGLQASVWEKFCNNVLRRGNHKKKKIIAATQELNKFYNTTLIPALDSSLINFGKFWFQEKCRCTEQGVVWKEIFYY